MSPSHVRLPRPRLHDESLTNAERLLFEQCAADFPSDDIHVSPLKRFGHSGARLFRAHFDEDGDGAAFVIKIGTVEKTVRDMEGLNRARRYFNTTDAAMSVIDGSIGDIAAIRYKLFLDDDGKIVDFRDYYRGQKVVAHLGGATAAGDEDVQVLLERTYRLCRIAHKPKAVIRRLGEEFHWYLRTEEDDRIADVYGTSARIDYLGRRYLNPAVANERIKLAEFSVAYGFVHGDLHTSNVMLDNFQTPGLIDFGWAHQGDVLTDYVLMECSLRFQAFPSNIDWEQHRQVTVDLLSERGYEVVIDRYESDPELVHRNWYLRMARAVQTIRREARRAAGELFNFENYLADQFLVLYGLSRLDHYPFFPTVDALGALGTRVVEQA